MGARRLSIRNLKYIRPHNGTDAIQHHIKHSRQPPQELGVTGHTPRCTAGGFAVPSRGSTWRARGMRRTWSSTPRRCSRTGPPCRSPCRERGPRLPRSGRPSRGRWTESRTDPDRPEIDTMKGRLSESQSSLGTRENNCSELTTNCGLALLLRSTHSSSSPLLLTRQDAPVHDV